MYQWKWSGCDGFPLVQLESPWFHIKQWSWSSLSYRLSISDLSLRLSQMCIYMDIPGKLFRSTIIPYHYKINGNLYWLYNKQNVICKHHFSDMCCQDLREDPRGYSWYIGPWPGEARRGLWISQEPHLTKDVLFWFLHIWGYFQLFLVYLEK